jgi:hypothetical protein
MRLARISFHDIPLTTRCNTISQYIYSKAIYPDRFPLCPKPLLDDFEDTAHDTLWTCGRRELERLRLETPSMSMAGSASSSRSFTAPVLLEPSGPRTSSDQRFQPRPASGPASSARSGASQTISRIDSTIVRTPENPWCLFRTSLSFSFFGWADGPLRSHQRRLEATLPSTQGFL